LAVSASVESLTAGAIELVAGLTASGAGVSTVADTGCTAMTPHISVATKAFLIDILPSIAGSRGLIMLLVT
jgi:hypothetical protein